MQISQTSFFDVRNGFWSNTMFITNYYFIEKICGRLNRSQHKITCEPKFNSLCWNLTISKNQYELNKISTLNKGSHVIWNGPYSLHRPPVKKLCFIAYFLQTVFLGVIVRTRVCSGGIASQDCLGNGREELECSAPPRPWNPWTTWTVCTVNNLLSCYVLLFH